MVVALANLALHSRWCVRRLWPACDGDITVVAVTPTGTIPAIWANLRYLSILSLTGNKIKGKWLLSHRWLCI
jgi:hypothetical protein